MNEEDKILYIKKYDITKNVEEELQVEDVISLFYKDYNTSNFFINFYIKNIFNKTDSDEAQNFALITNGIFRYEKDMNLEYTTQKISQDGKNDISNDFEKISIIFDENESYIHLYEIFEVKSDLIFEQTDDGKIQTKYNNEIIPNIPFYISYDNTEFLEVLTDEFGLYTLNPYTNNYTIRFYGDELFNPCKLKVLI